MADIKLRSYQEILGLMAAKLMAVTDLNDLSKGSVFLTLLEAAASSDFSTEGRLLQVLNLRNIDKATSVDLENLAYEMGLTRTRLGAEPASVKLTVRETAFTKKYTNIYAGATSPAAGDTELKVIDASSFSASGTIYIGRKTPSYESINYISVQNTGSYWRIALSSPLSKDHLVGEEVVLAQGGNRLIPAGTSVSVPDSNETFITSVEARILDGDDSVSGIPATATEPGSEGNVGINKISQFDSSPWSTAAVSNPEAATGGRDIETDAELRQRIKDHVHNIGRGTKKALLSEIIGTTDNEDGKRVVSAFLREPTSTDQRGILFIDDGTGFSPSFSGIGEEVIVTKAFGTESFFQLQKWPLVKSQVASVSQEPFALSGGEKLYIEVDGEYEERSLPASSFRTAGVALAQEVAEAINKTFVSVEARAKDGLVFITPVSDDPDYIKVGKATSGIDANDYLRFPSRRQYTIRLYKNDKLLEKNGSDAVIQTKPYVQWPVFGSSETMQLNVDGILGETVTITNQDFAIISGSNTIQGATVADWAKVINKKFIGVTATAKDDGTFTIKSNKGRIAGAYIEIVSGSLKSSIFGTNTSGVGKEPDYNLNRLLGQIQLTERLAQNDELKAGTVKTTGSVKSAAQAVYDLSKKDNRAPELVFVPDKTADIVDFAQLYDQTFSVPLNGFQRIISSYQPPVGGAGQYSNVKADDWCYLYNLPRNGLFKVKEVGPNGSYVDLFDPNPTADSVTLNVLDNTMKFFRTEGVPQICVLPFGPAVSSESVVDAINSQVLGVSAEMTDAGEIKVYSTRLESGSGLSLVAVSGSATNLSFTEGSYPSNDPHTASIESDDLTGIPTDRIVIENPDISDPFDSIYSNNLVFDEITDANKGVLTYIGASAGYIRQPLERTSDISLTVRNDSPYQRVGFGDDMRGTKISWMEFGQEDNMVFLIDNDAAKKTFDIPLYIEATVSGTVPPTKRQFDLVDATGALIGPSSRWAGHRFEDYKVWFQARANLPTSTPNSQLKVSAVPFGPTGSHISFGIFYPTAPSSDSTVMYSTDHANASYYIDPLNDKILVQLMLASGDERLIGLEPNKRIYINASQNGSHYTKRITFLHPVNLSTVIPGDIVTINDSSADQRNRGEMRIDKVSNLVDFGLSYQFLQETVVGAVSNGGTGVYLDTPSVQELRVGDKIQVVGIRQQIQNVYNNSISKIVGGVGNGQVITSSGGSFKPTNGSFKVGNETYTYTNYQTITTTINGVTSTTGEFTGVEPNPSPGGSPPLIDVNDILVQNNFTISVPAGGLFTETSGSFQVNGVSFAYNNYSNNKFEYVSPDPTGIATVGSNLTQNVYTGDARSKTAFTTAVSETQQSATIDTSISVGTGYVFALTHKCLSVSGSPNFEVATGDIVQVGANVMRITSIIDQNRWDVDNPFSFTSFQSGVASRIYVEGKRAKECVNQSFAVLSSETCQIYDLPNAKNIVSNLKKVINETAGVKDLVILSDAIGSNGTGSIDYSTEDELMNGQSYVSLKNSESFVYSVNGESPAITLKEALNEDPFIGDKARLIPATSQNILDHFSRKQITGLTIAADVKLVDNGRRLQVSSKTSGGFGQVFAVGGRGSGLNVLALRGTPQEISVNRGLLEFDRSAVDILATGQSIKLSQTGRAKKSFTGSQPTSTTSISLFRSPGSTTTRITLGVPFVTIYPYSHLSNVTWAVRKIGRNRMRYEVLSGSATLPASLKADDWVLIGDGETYAGETPAQVFSSGNQGWFQVLETDNANYFDVENYGIEEFVKTSNKPFLFTPYHSARVGDQIVIGTDLNFLSVNKGTFTITNVAATNQVDYINSNGTTEGPVTLGSGTNTISILDQGFSTYRKVVIVNPKPNDPTNRAQVVVSPGYNIQLFNENYGAKLTLPTRLGFGTDPTPGMSGYQFWTGLKRRAQRVIDGYEPDPTTFPGTRASGAQIEVREPQIQKVTLQLKVKTQKGVSLQSLTDTIKSAITGYINSLGLGQDVILSECIKLVQAVPGVDSVVMSFPSPGTERITINSNAIARISSSDVLLS